MTNSLPALDAEIAPYIVRWPYVSNQIGEQPDGNPILYQALYLAVKRRFTPVTVEDKAWVSTTYELSNNEPGLLNRGQHKRPDWQAHDDYIGMVYSSHITGEFKAAIDIYVYGKNNFWFFDNVGLPWYKKPKAFFGRHPGFVPLIKLALRKKLNWFDQLSFSIAVRKNRDESGIQMAFLMADLYKTQPYRYPLIDAACEAFEESVIERYPHEMGGVFQVYFDREKDFKKPPKHIFARWMQGRM